MKLENRIAALEQKAGVGRDRIDVILRTIVSPSANGPAHHPITALACDGAGWSIKRQADESEQAFLVRAYATVPRPAHGVASLRQVLA